MRPGGCLKTEDIVHTLRMAAALIEHIAHRSLMSMAADEILVLQHDAMVLREELKSKLTVIDGLNNCMSAKEEAVASSGRNGQALST